MYKIAVIPGDGTGPEVTREGAKVLAAAASAAVTPPRYVASTSPGLTTTARSAIAIATGVPGP